MTEGDLNRFGVLGTVLAIVLVGTLDAHGVQENRIARAKELIAEQNYNDAILILTTVVREEPDRQDEAQELIRQIVALRNQYNEDYETLIDLLYVQKDEATALKVIAQLEGLDKNPNRQTLEDIRQAKRTARLIANNKRYRDIMARALERLEAREYASAVAVYLEGQDLAKDMFLESGLGNVLTNQVDRNWDELKSIAAVFAPAEPRIRTFPAQGVSVLASESSAVTLEPLLASMRDLAAWRQRVLAIGRFFRAQNELLLKNDRQEDFFLSYSALFITGPPDGQGQGILGAFDRLWAEVMEPWSRQIQTGIEARYVQAKGLFDRGDWTAAAAAFEGLRVRARQGADVLALWNRLAGVDAQGALDPAHLARMPQILPLQLWVDRRLTLAVQGLRTAQYQAQTRALALAETREALEAARAEVRTQRLAYASFETSATAWSSQDQGLTLIDPPTFARAWQASWASYRLSTLALEADFVDRRGRLDYGGLESRFQSLQSSLAQARDQVEGRIKYPLQASQRLQELMPLQDDLARGLNAFVALYDSEPAEIKTPAVLRWPQQGRDLLARLGSAQTLRGQLLVAAQANYARSQDLRRQGRELLASFDIALSTENFTQARAVLGQTSTRYSQSLALQEDEGFRTESDAHIKELFDRVLRAENEVVVREVRRLITQGSQAYLAQLFTQAEQILTRARNRWASTNVEPNSEVEYWLTLASYALSVTTGRELSPIDPLYNEVQQLLNFARRDFTMGKERMSAGDQTGGLDAMARAKEVLSKILLPFPLNQEARLLNLEILQASDPANFPTLFRQNFEAAVARIATEPNVAYNDLLDLDKIQPGYPAMATAIQQARRKLGLDRAPVDNTAVQQARNLVAQASRLVSSGSQTQLTQAQSLVRQALQRDPDNAQAQELSDRISLRLAPTVGTKTPTIIGELNEIQDLLRSQRSLEALSRITEFKAKYPNLVSDSQVKELERRIRAVN